MLIFKCTKCSLVILNTELKVCHLFQIISLEHPTKEIPSVWAFWARKLMEKRPTRYRRILCTSPHPTPRHVFQVTSWRRAASVTASGRVPELLAILREAIRTMYRFQWDGLVTGKILAPRNKRQTLEPPLIDSKN